MSGVQKIITQRNRVKQPQYVSEGITTATYGVTPTNPVFIPIGCNTIIDDNSSPNSAEQRQSGDMDRKRKDFISKNASMTLKTQMTFFDVNLLIWALSKPTDPTNTIDTPDESRTFIDSYRDISGTEIFRQFLGCKPTGWSFTEDRAGYLVLEITCSCKDILESLTSPVIGTGKFATPAGGGILTITGLFGGVGYQAGEAVTLSAPVGGGTTATATAIDDGAGEIISLTIVTPGTGYVVGEKVTIEGVSSGELSAFFFVATATQAVPYTHKDAGTLPFLYNGVGFSSSNFISTGTIPQAPQDAIGSTKTLFQVPTQRIITGSISIYKKDEELQTLAKAVDESKDAVYTFDSARSLSISLSKFLWLPSTEELSGDDATATMENKSYEASSIVVIVA